MLGIVYAATYAHAEILRRKELLERQYRQYVTVCRSVQIPYVTKQEFKEAQERFKEHSELNIPTPQEAARIEQRLFAKHEAKRKEWEKYSEYLSICNTMGVEPINKEQYDLARGVL